MVTIPMMHAAIVRQLIERMYAVPAVKSNAENINGGNKMAPAIDKKPIPNATYCPSL